MVIIMIETCKKSPIIYDLIGIFDSKKLTTIKVVNLPFIRCDCRLLMNLDSMYLIIPTKYVQLKYICHKCGSTKYLRRIICRK